MKESGGRRRVGLTFVDQAVSSASNFGTGVIVARVAGAVEFGQFMLVFMIWVVALGTHRALVSEPMVITSPDVGNRSVPVAHGVGAEVLLAAAMSVVVAVAGLAALAAGASYGGPLLALAPWFVPLIVQDYWRAMVFQLRRPGLALANDLVFAGVQVLAVVACVATGRRSVEWIIAAWGVGASAGALLGFRWFPGISRPVEGLRLLRRLWPTSRWLAADFSTGFASDQAYLVFAAVLLSQTDYGGFRAAVSLTGPVVVILLAGGNIGLPDAARRVGTGDWEGLRTFARRLTMATLVCVGVYGALVAGAGRQLLDVLYGEEFAGYDLLATLSALRYVLLVSVFGQLIALKAAGRMRRLWRARLLMAALSAVSMVVLVSWLGPAGAGWSGVVTAVSYAVAIYLIYRAELREPTADLSEPEVPPPARLGPEVRDRELL